ncbi:ubiquitin-like protein Pup [Scrofimicrobium sp. R131]|uniref:Prokaryotic ubiquitin-like protein Pup n=1 Tax=Scrofimicrobium appendicitidis TaxID=3079930 RepID=A0AAU7V5I8_9ACTO
MSSTQIYGGSGPDDEEPMDLPGGQIQVNALDSILDEIDTVLEQNAEAFVQGFVQKGGQ